MQPDRARLARYGVKAEDALAAVEAARVGVPVGSIYEGQRRFDLRVLVPPRTPTAEALGELFVEAAGGTTRAALRGRDDRETEGPTQVRRENLDAHRARRREPARSRSRLVGRRGARAGRSAGASCRPATRSRGAGSSRTSSARKKRLAMVVPMALAIIFGMLLWMFQSARYALAVFAVVPFALTGGILGLHRARPVLQHSRGGRLHRARRRRGAERRRHGQRREAASSSAAWPLDEAIVDGATHTMRAVLTTGAVAAFGFLPMALATGAGAEVQRPLATVVVSGIASRPCSRCSSCRVCLQLFLREPRRQTAQGQRRAQAGDAIGVADALTCAPSLDACCGARNIRS